MAILSLSQDLSLVPPKIDRRVHNALQRHSDFARLAEFGYFVPFFTNINMSNLYTIKEKLKIVGWMQLTGSPTEVQREFSNFYGRDPPCRATIRNIWENFQETGSVANRYKGGTR
jgi:hypothetical protein